MSNRYPGYCVTCQRQVGANHGDLSRSASGAYVVRCSRSASGGGAPSEPRKAGICAAAEGVAQVTRRDAGRDASVLVGETYRLSARAGGALAGQVVTVVGASCYYESAEHNEDCGDMQGGGWRATLYVRAATAAEAAPVLAAEGARAAAAKKTVDDAAAAKAAHDAAVAAATAGLVATTCRPDGRTTRETLSFLRASSCSSSSLARHTLEDGSVYVIVERSSGDMDQWTVYGTAAQVRAWRLAWAASSRITRAAAQDYVARYGDCYGADDYRALLDLLDDETDAVAERAEAQRDAERAAERDLQAERSYEHDWTAAQLAAPARRARLERETEAKRAAALAALSPVQRAALAAIEAAGELGARIVARAADAEVPAAGAVVRELEHAHAADPGDARLGERLAVEQARRGGGPTVAAREPTLAALERAGLVRLDGGRAWAVRS